MVVQGITSGPVWDRVCRLLISLTAPNTTGCAASCRARSHRGPPSGCARACVDVITELVDGHTAAGRCDMVTDIAQPYPVPIICALLGAPREDWRLFSTWAADISKAFGFNVAEETIGHRACVGATRRLYRGVDRSPAAVPGRRPDL